MISENKKLAGGRKILKKSILIGISILFTSIQTFGLNTSSLIADLETQYTQKIKETYSFLSDKDIKVSFKNLMEFKTMPSNTKGYDFSIPENANVLGKTILPLSFLDQNNNVIHKIKVAALVRAYTNQLFTVRPLQKKHPLTESDITIQYAEYLGDKRYPLTLEDIQNKETISNIPANSALLPWMVKEVPDIRQGNSVAITYNDNGMVLKVRGVALSDGYIGKNIRVQSKFKSKKVLKGKVVDSHHVKVDISH